MGEDNSGYWFQRMGRKIVALRPVSWLTARTFHHIDPLVYGMSGGRFTMASLAVGLPVILLTTTGAKSGRKRSVPLIGIPYGDKYAVIASNWGQKRFPAWYYNLKTNPQVEVDDGGSSGEYIAREADPEEYESYWKKAISMYGGYSEYKKRARGRRIPVIVLESLEGMEPT